MKQKQTLSRPRIELASFSKQGFSEFSAQGTCLSTEGVETDLRCARRRKYMIGLPQQGGGGLLPQGS
jgi:hypothetical protein